MGDMKIVMLCDLYDERSQYQENLLAKYYTKHGHGVTIVASTFDTPTDYYADAYDPASVRREYFDGRAKVIKLPYQLNILNKLRRFGGVRAILEQERPDLIFVHDIHLNLSDAAWYKRAHPECRVIMDYHADYSNSAKNWLSLNVLHKVIRRRYLYWNRRAIDKIYPVVPVSAVFLSEVYGIPKSEMELLPLGADIDAAKQAVANRPGESIRDELGISREAIVIFTGGRLAPLKQTHCLLDAFLQLSDPRIHVVVTGTAAPGHDDYVARMVGQCGSNPRVHFVGWVEGKDIYSYMDACDFAVFPASQSVLWQQAIAMGLPIVVGQGTHLGDQDPTYLNLYDNVIILERGTIRGDVIAEKIREMASDRTLLANRRAGARRVATELLNYDTIVARTLSL
jgi:glycosyltransferase involved in cell wall biosynthesis